MSNTDQITAIKHALSAVRIRTYETAVGTLNDAGLSALNLYLWNAQISGALLVPLHLCEVVIRNAVADALEHKYGNCWPWSSGFETSLPSPATGYSPRQDLINARRHAHAVDKIIPELKFAFWQNMFTSRHDHRLWKTHLSRIMPGLNVTKPINDLRKMIYDALEDVRRLRNRIAHHEPVFSRNLAQDFSRMAQLIAYRSAVTADWMLEHHHRQIQVLLQTRPRSCSHMSIA